MPVPVQTPYIEYTGNGSTTSFPLTFDCEKAEFLIVTINGTAAVVGSWSLAGGNVIFTTPPAVAALVVFKRSTPNVRTSNYNQYDNSFRPLPVNKDFDKIWIRLQELGVEDWLLWRGLNAEIAARIAADVAYNQLSIDRDNALQAYLVNKINDVYANLSNSLITEINNRVAGDNATALSAREYTDFMLRMNASMAMFDGVSDNIVILPDGSNQRSLNIFQKRKNEERKSIYDFLIPGESYTDVTFDWTTVVARAITFMKNRGGGQIYFPKNQYLFNGAVAADGKIVGIQIPFTGGSDTGATAVSIDLIGECRDTSFLCGVNNMIMIRHSSSYSEIGNFQILANGKTGCWGLALIPENVTNANTASQQSHNCIYNMYLSELHEGIVLQSGGDGGAYYNLFSNIHIHGGAYGGRGVWLSPGTVKSDTTLASPPNRNRFFSVRVANANVGFHLASGDTNQFFGCAVEGITRNTNTHQATPTGLIVERTDGQYGIQGNNFFGWTAENCTREAVILQPRTGFFGFILRAAKCILAEDVLTLTDSTFVGSYDPTTFPTMLGGLLTVSSGIVFNTRIYTDNTTYTEGTYTLTTGVTVRSAQGIFDVGGSYRNYTLNTTRVTNMTSVIAQVSQFRQLGQIVDWDFRADFRVASTTTPIEIILPKIANATLYQGGIANLRNHRFFIRLANGFSAAYVEYEAALSDDGAKITLAVPTAEAWDAAYVYVQARISYRVQT